MEKKDNSNGSNSRQKKDTWIILAFVALAIANGIANIVISGVFSVGELIQQTILILFGYIGLLEVFRDKGWDVFVPTFMSSKKKKYETELVADALREAALPEYTEAIVKNALRHAGIERDDVKNLVARKNFETGYHDIHPANLIEIISKYMIRHEGKVEYGYKTPIRTSFYICSVEASYDADYLDWMCSLLSKLILDMKDAHAIDYLPDFIVTPKGGNTHLGRTYAEKRHAIFITSKYSLRSSYVRYLTKASEYELKTNYEGFWELLEKEKGLQEGEKLRGIVVDCNTATGEQIFDTMVDLNKLIAETGIRVEPLQYAFTLYKSTDSSCCDIDRKFGEKGFRFFRYFDLSEKDKELIWKKRGCQDKLSVYSEEGRASIEEILKQIKPTA